MVGTDGGSDVATATGRWTLGTGVGVVLVLVGAVVGATRLGDNSFFTHLATGRLILDSGSVPTTDPYTFTAAGDAWTVQSWFASVVYALSEDVAGLAGPRLVHLVLAALVAAITWRLAAPAVSLVPRLLVGALAVAAGGFFWSERPLMIGLACFGALLLLWERGPVWAVLPLMWVWVNSHGSFPLAVVLVGVLLVGRWLDGAEIDRGRRVAALTVVGMLLGGLISPLSGRILVFPLTLLGRTDQLQAVTEWQSPDFASWGPRLFLVQLVLGLLAARRVDRWEVVLPPAVFVAAALLGARNVPLAVLTLTPLLAHGAPRLGELRSDTRSPLALGLVGVGLAGIAVVVLSLGGGDHLDLADYPVTEVAALEDEGVLPATDAVRVAHSDVVGNFLEYRYGTDAHVFFDDRYDLYDEATLADMIDLHHGRKVLEVLDRYEIDVVVWRTDSSVVEQLSVADGWAADPPLEPLEGAPERDDGTTGWTVLRRVAG